MSTVNFNDSVCTSGFHGYFDKISTPTRRKWWFNGDSNWMGFIHGTDAYMPCGGGASQPFWFKIDGAASVTPTISAGQVVVFNGATDVPHLVQIGINAAYSGGNAWTFLDGTNALFSVTGATPGVSAFSASMTHINASGAPIKYYGATHEVNASTNIQPRTRNPSTNANIYDGFPNWQQDKNYVLGDTIAGSGAYNGYYYQCWKPHTSSVSGFAYDLGLNNWAVRNASYELGSTIAFDAKTSEIWLFCDATYVGYSIDNGQLSTIQLSGETGKKIWRKVLSNLDNTQFHRYYLIAGSANPLLNECNGVMLSPDGQYRPVETPRTLGQYGDSITFGAGATEGYVCTDYHRVAAMGGCLGSANGVSGHTNYDIYKMLHYHSFKNVPNIAIYAGNFNNTVYSSMKRMRNNNVATFKVVGTSLMNPQGTRSIPVSGNTITVSDSGNSTYNGNFFVTNVINNGTSSSTNTIGIGSKNFTISTNLDLSAGDILKVEYTASTSNYMYGPITSYNPSTGDLVLNSTTYSGAGTYSSWYIDGGVVSFACSGENESWTTDTSAGFVSFYYDCIDKLLSLGCQRVLVRPSIPGGGGDPGFRSAIKGRLALQLVNSISDPRVVYVDVTDWVGIPTAEGTAPWGVGGGLAGTHPTSAGYYVMANYEFKQYQRLFRPWLTRMPSFLKSTRGYIRPPNSSAGGD